MRMLDRFRAWQERQPAVPIAELIATRDGGEVGESVGVAPYDSRAHWPPSVEAPGRDGVMSTRDRVTELRRVPASELRKHPRNWRRHPERQARAMTDLLARVGYAGALVARETADGLQLLDGHLRQELAGDEVVPVLVLDVDDAEAELLLASLDPVGDMAEVDPEMLNDLLGSVAIQQGDLEEFIRGLLPADLDALAGLSETAFLDEEAGEDGAGAWHAETPGNPYFTVTVAVTAEQRQVIREALEAAKKVVDPPTTPAAMVEVCRRYLEGA